MLFPCTPSPTVISDTLDADTIVIDVKTGAYYTLTAPAASLWQQALAGGCEVEPGSGEAGILRALVDEGLLTGPTPDDPAAESSTAYSRYTDMEELLLADPIHEVEADGWPMLKPPGVGG